MKNKIQTIMAKHDPWHEDDFDSYENNEPVGCKYCGCYHFKLAKDNSESKCSCEH